MFHKLLVMITVVIVCAVTSVASTARPTRDFQLVSDGAPAATIVVSKSQSRSAAFAVREFQYHIQKMTGEVLPVASDDETVSGRRVLIGESRATQRVGLRNEDLASQEYLIRFLPDTLVLMGKDEDLPIRDVDKPLPRVRGKFGNAVSLNGTDRCLSINECGLDDSEGTLEAWVWMPAKTQSADGTIMRLDSAEPWTYRIVQRPAHTSKIEYRVYDGSNLGILASGDLPEGWHHVMATHSASKGKMELFVDGVSQGSAGHITTQCARASLHLGGIGGASGVGNPYAGLIDEVRVSNVVRTAVPGGQAKEYWEDINTRLLLHLDDQRDPRERYSGPPNAISAPEYFTEKGTMDAVYDFLERFCGVDWFAPGEIGLLCPTRQTLVVKGSDIRRSPSFRYRWMTPTALYMPTPDDRVSDNDTALWRYRMRIGGEYYWATHSFGGYFSDFLETHPEWFAQGYQGGPPQMCYSNAGFTQQVITDAREYFHTGKRRSGASVSGDHYGLVPQDNCSWCKCAECQAKMNASEKDNPQFSNGRASNYLFGFINKVAAETAMTNPGKRIAALAYSDYAYYPDKVELEPNVSVMMCLHTRNWWCPSMEKNDRKVFNQWVTSEAGRRHLYVWLYYCFPALQSKVDGYATFPGFFAHSLVKQTRMYHKAGIRGIFLEHSSEFGQSYLGDQVELYLQWKLANDIDQDAEALLDRFFTGYYGRAGRQMKKLYLEMEEVFSSPSTYPDSIRKSPATHHQSRELTYDYLATSARLARYLSFIKRAEAEAASDIEKKRVEYFNRAILQPLVEGVEKNERFKMLRKTTPPSMTLPRVHTGRPGELSGFDWSRAADMGQWSNVQGGKTQRKVTSRLAHDGQFLYIELQEEMDPRQLVAGPQVYDGDDWEVFFAGQRSGASRQLIIGPTGRVSAIARDTQSGEWNSGAVMESETREAGKWRVRLAIPLSSLLPGGVAPGGKFYANFYRASPESTRLLAWSPNYLGSFHDLSRTGEFTLGE